MTPTEQTAYWRKYAKQNAKMERLAYRIMVLALRRAAVDVFAYLDKNGVELTLQNIEGIVSRSVINAAYSQLYRNVGVKQKAWADADVKARFPKRKSMQRKDEEDERWRPRRLTELLTPDPVSTPNFELGFFNAKWLARLKNIVDSIDTIEKVNSVKSTIAKRFRQSISRASQEFVTITKIKRRLRSDFSELTARQAETIARTEVTYISNLAQEEAAVETGLDLVKVWIRTLDDRTRDTHVNAPRKPIKSTEKFKVGGKEMDKPGDPAGGLANTINCRCVASYLPADDYEDLLDDEGDFQSVPEGGGYDINDLWR